MREEPFFCFQLSDELEQEIWEDCVFVLDTSALLELYFYSSSSQKKIFDKVLRPLKNRLWIPSHVEFEYLKNRESSIKKPIAEKYKPIQADALNDISSHIKNLKAKINDLMQKTQKKETHPYFDQEIFDKLLNSIDSSSAEFDNFLKLANDQIEARKAEIEAQEKNDTVFSNLKDLLSVGGDYSFSRKMEILAESEIRFRNKIPPGYKDADGKDQKEGLQRIGDLIIWKQIIDYAAASKKPIVFVTNDVKEDWCYATKRSNEVRIDRPREELIQELFSEANVKFWMYNFPQFLYACKKIMHVSIGADVIEEAEDAARERFSESLKLRFDGVYKHVHDESGQVYFYFRFFSNGAVIRANRSQEMTSEELQRFDEKSAPMIGSFILNGKLISFSIISEQGVIDYSGVVDDDCLTLAWYSHINGKNRNGMVCKFIPFEGISPSSTSA